jgi:altronate dehydratase large subunit
MSDEFLGFKRENGSVGVRNLIAIIPSVFCSAKVAQRISESVPGTVHFSHPVGCSQVGEDLEITAKTLIGIGRNPNFAGVVVIAPTGKMVEMVVIQDEGDSIKAIDIGTRHARKMQQVASQERRVEADVSELMIGLNCGGSDTTSGLVANPALGIASDKLVAQGGSSILTELTELLGTEHILARRAVNEQVASDILRVIRNMEERLKQQTRHSSNEKRKNLISTGNYDGGLSSVVEKSLGGMKKSGNAQFVEVFAYGDVPTKKGLLLLDGPGHDGEVTTGQAAAGAQIVCFPTGRGTPSGFPGVPVIKITGNPRTFQRMKENIDINAGAVITGEKSLQEVGEEIYQEILAVASGKLSKAEVLGHDEQFCITRMP